MSSIRITPHPLCGEITPPVSKSDAHRAIICATLAVGESHIGPLTMSDDIKATVSCLKNMGAEIYEEGDILRIRGGVFNKRATFDCGESGSTLRFLLPIVAALGIEAKFTGRGRLPQRPIDTMLELLNEHGVQSDSRTLPLTIHGRLSAGEYRMPGDISSQYVTGLLLALPLLRGTSRIILTSPLQSSGYVDMTIKTMRKFGINIKTTYDGYIVNGLTSGGIYIPCDYRIEGDWSSAAFPIAAAAIGGKMTVNGLSFDSIQGDRAAEDIFARFGADIRRDGDKLCVLAGDLHGISVDASEIPDMIPAIAAVAAFAKGDTLIHSAGRLRIKESDRLSAIANALTSAGIAVEEGPDSLLIHGGQPKGCTIGGCNDHRIVMAFSVMAAYSEGETVITDMEAVAKSYPAFFEDFRKSGGIADVL